MHYFQLRIHLNTQMDQNLQLLIAAYHATVKRAVILMSRSGIKMPYSSFAWIQADIPSIGMLDGNVPYFKHGAGCEVIFETGPVDFDFGENGEIDGFDLWRLTRFTDRGHLSYGFRSPDEIEQAFNEAAMSGELHYSGNCLYYCSNHARELAVDIDSRLPGDRLPSASQDGVLNLYTHYFLAADLMLKNYQKLNRKWDKFGRLSRNDEIQIRIYFFSWLGYLGVVCEAIKKLNIRNLLMQDRPDQFRKIVPLSDVLGKIIKSHSDSLRKFRNSVFHLRDNPEDVRNFFERDANRLEWAKELHKVLGDLFSEYRVSCEVHYLINNRKGEMDLRRT